MSNEANQTLGQRIDAVLEPLYLEADQYRQTIAQVTVQKNELQQQIEQAEQGLGQIESRMVEVVRALAQKDPVIAAVVGQSPAPSTAEPPAPPAEPQQAPAEPGTEVQEAPASEAEPAAAL